MRQSIGGSQWKDCQCNIRVCQTLNYIVDRAVAATSEDRVAPRRHRYMRVLRRFLAGMADGEFRADSRRLQNADSMFQLTSQPPSAARVGIKQDGGFAHTPGRS